MVDCYSMNLVFIALSTKIYFDKGNVRRLAIIRGRQGLYSASQRTLKKNKR